MMSYQIKAMQVLNRFVCTRLIVFSVIPSTTKLGWFHRELKSPAPTPSTFWSATLFLRYPSGRFDAGNASALKYMCFGLRRLRSRSRKLCSRRADRVHLLGEQGLAQHGPRGMGLRCQSCQKTFEITLKPGGKIIECAKSETCPHTAT